MPMGTANGNSGRKDENRCRSRLLSCSERIGNNSFCQPLRPPVNEILIYMRNYCQTCLNSLDFI